MLNLLTPKQETLDRMVGELQSLATDFEKNHRLHQIACLELEEGVAGADKRKQQAQAELARITARRGELEGALLAARAREEEANAAATKVDLLKAAATVSKASRARIAAAMAMEPAIVALADAWANLVKATGDLNQALPDKNAIDLDGALLRAVAIESKVRLALMKRGVDWAADPSYRYAVPDEFAPQFKDAATVVDRWVERVTFSAKGV